MTSRVRLHRQAVRVGIVGAGGLAAGVLIRLLKSHPRVTLSRLVSESGRGKRVGDLHRGLLGVADHPLVPYDAADLARSCDVIFLCRGHGEGVKDTEQLLKRGPDAMRVIDLSGNLRLRKASAYRDWYHFDHPVPGMLRDAVYGLTELHRDEIRRARLVANPGCYPTSALLGLAPLLKAGAARPDGIIISATSGVSGAGRSEGGRNLFVDMEGNLVPYKVGVHQHVPEIEQELRTAAGRDVAVTFVPHVVGFSQGLLSTMYVRVAARTTSADLTRTLARHYAASPFIRVLPVDGPLPEVRPVVGTNYCDLGVRVDARTSTAVVFSALDNLYKGAAGQAIQNMNLMLGWSEATGLLPN